MTLSLEHVTKVVGRQTHMADINLSLEPGSVNVLLGLTLAGKTTLMRLMAGLDKPTDGRVLSDGRDVAGIPLRKRNVAMVYQQFINYPSLTVFENIASPLRIAGVSKGEIDRRVRDQASRLGIDHLLDRLPGELSGGQQQRTAMARAMVRDAKLLLLDEPLVNLDYKLREDLRADLKQIFAQRDSIVVYATTDPAEALAFGGNTAVLHEGRLVQFGPTMEVHDRPANEHVAAVFSDPPMNRVPGRISAGEVLIGSQLRMPVPRHLSGLGEGDFRFGLRPHHLKLGEQGNPYVLTAEVEVAEINGSDTIVHLQSDGQPWIAVLEGVHAFRPGETVHLHVPPERLIAFDNGGDLLVAPPTSRSQRPEVSHGTH